MNEPKSSVHSSDMLTALLESAIKTKAESDAIKGSMGAAVQSDVCHVIIKIITEAQKAVNKEGQHRE